MTPTSLNLDPASTCLDDVKAALSELECYVLAEAGITDFAEYLRTKPTALERTKPTM